MVSFVCSGCPRGWLGVGCATDLCISVGKEESMFLLHLTFGWEWTESGVWICFFTCWKLSACFPPFCSVPILKVNVLGTAFDKTGKWSPLLWTVLNFTELLFYLSHDSPGNLSMPVYESVFKKQISCMEWNACVIILFINLLVGIFWVHNRPLNVEKGLLYVCYEVIGLWVLEQGDLPVFLASVCLEFVVQLLWASVFLCSF